MSSNNRKKAHYQVMMGSYTVEDFVQQIDDAYDETKQDEDGYLGKLTKKGILIAPFQRTYQWHTEGYYPEIFLDSLNRNIFVMPIILVEHDQQTWIIDGQQRLATLYCYVKGFTPKDDEPIKWKKLIVAIKREDLTVVKPCEWTKFDGKEFNKEDIKQTPIGYSFLFNVDHKDNKELLLQIFDRINNQGMQLTEAETIRAYGWLYPDSVQYFIDLVDKSTYEYNLDYLSHIRQEKSKENKILIFVFFNILNAIYRCHIKNIEPSSLEPKKIIEILIQKKDFYDECKIITKYFIDNSLFFFDFTDIKLSTDANCWDTLKYSCAAIVDYAFEHEYRFPEQKTLHEFRCRLWEEMYSCTTNAYDFLTKLMANE